MKFLASALAAAIATASIVLTAPPAPARANVFCPVTIAAISNLALLGREDTYGVLLDFDAGDTASGRMRVDSATARYAVDFNDIGPLGNDPARGRRYFVMPPGERLVSAWIESTGLSPDSRMECPITRPYAVDEPAPVNPRTLAALEVDCDIAKLILQDRRQRRLSQAAKQRAHPRQQFLRVERLNEVIVRSGAQALHAVIHLRPSGQHQDAAVKPAFAHRSA